MSDSSPTDPAETLVAINNHDASRYELTVDEEMVGEAAYRKSGEIVTVYHVEIEPALQGRTLGTRFAKWILDDIREHDQKINPRCPFMERYIELHPEYADLVGR